jgi:hypothetical protein
MFTVLPCVHTYWGDTMSEALRVLRTHGMITLSIPKKETSSEELLRKLSMNGLELGELIDDDTTLDYIVISKKTESGHVTTSKKRSNTSLTGSGGLVNNDQGRHPFKASMSDSNSLSLISPNSWLAFSLIRSRSFAY